MTAMTHALVLPLLAGLGTTELLITELERE